MFIDEYDKSIIYMVTDDEECKIKVILPMIYTDSELDSVIEDICNGELSVSDYFDRHAGSQTIYAYKCIDAMNHYSDLAIEGVCTDTLFKLQSVKSSDISLDFGLAMLTISIEGFIGKKLPEFLYYVSGYMTEYYYWCMMFIKEAKLDTHEKENIVFKTFYSFIYKINNEYAEDQIQCFGMKDILERFKESEDIEDIKHKYLNREKIAKRLLKFKSDKILNLIKKVNVLDLTKLSEDQIVDPGDNLQVIQPKKQKPSVVQNISIAERLMNQVIYDSENRY